MRRLNEHWEYMQKWQTQLLADTQLMFKKTYDSSQQNIALIEDNAKYKQALLEISQSSDHGGYERAITDMKQIAHRALKQ